MNRSFHKVTLLTLLPFLAVSCSPKALTDQERFHQAYLNVIEASEDEIRPLICLTEEETKITWNQTKDKVLLFTFHRYPDSYKDGESLTIHWDSWLCSVKEYAMWYRVNKGNITDPLLRTKQVLGMDEASANTYISSLWISPSDVKRPAYVTDPTKQMALTFDENESEEYKQWFKDQFFYSYETKRMPWTRLGYTYDWSAEAKDRYGLSEFVAFDGTEVTVDRTLPVGEFLSYIESN